MCIHTYYTGRLKMPNRGRQQTTGHPLVLGPDPALRHHPGGHQRAGPRRLRQDLRRRDPQRGLRHLHRRLGLRAAGHLRRPLGRAAHAARLGLSPLPVRLYRPIICCRRSPAFAHNRLPDGSLAIAGGARSWPGPVPGAPPGPRCWKIARPPPGGAGDALDHCRVAAARCVTGGGGG